MIRRMLTHGVRLLADIIVRPCIKICWCKILLQKYYKNLKYMRPICLIFSPARLGPVWSLILQVQHGVCRPLKNLTLLLAHCCNKILWLHCITAHMRIVIVISAFFCLFCSANQKLCIHCADVYSQLMGHSHWSLVLMRFTHWQLYQPDTKERTHSLHHLSHFLCHTLTILNVSWYNNTFSVNNETLDKSLCYTS